MLDSASGCMLCSVCLMGARRDSGECAALPALSAPLEWTALTLDHTHHRRGALRPHPQLCMGVTRAGAVISQTNKSHQKIKNPFIYLFILVSELCAATWDVQEKCFKVHPPLGQRGFSSGSYSWMLELHCAEQCAEFWHQKVQNIFSALIKNLIFTSMICDITNSLETNPGSIFLVHKCDVETWRHLVSSS